MEENRKILVIDDDEGIRDTYQEIFTPEKPPGTDVTSKGRALFDDVKTPVRPRRRKNDYQVSLAENGTRGIDAVKTAASEDRPFAIAFIDMKMPGLDGAETARKIWEIDPDIKIVIVTAYSEYTPEDIISVTGRNDIFYLRKPFNHEEILQFARALANEWNLEKKRDLLERQLKHANKELEQLNLHLREKVQNQAAMIVQAEKMASVGLLAAGVAHEINNPIAFVNANLAMVKKYAGKITGFYDRFSRVAAGVESADMTQAQSAVTTAEAYKKEHKIDVIMEDLEDLADESIDGIKRVQAIVSELKTFSRVDEAELKYIDINKAIDTTLNMAKTEIKPGIAVEKKYGDFPEIKCFPRKISQMLMNLMTNAAHAIEKNGRIDISTRLLSKGQRKTDRFIEIIVADTGCGIPEENLSKLFDPFFTTKPAGQGTGLGLSIVYEIIESHDGKIEVSSTPGDGTRFRVLLPAVFESDRDGLNT